MLHRRARDRLERAVPGHEVGTCDGHRQAVVIPVRARRRWRHRPARTGRRAAAGGARASRRCPRRRFDERRSPCGRRHLRPWEQAINRPGRGPEHDALKDWQCRTPLQLFTRMVDCVPAGPAPHYAADVIAAIGDHHPDRIVCEAAAQPKRLLAWFHSGWPGLVEPVAMGRAVSSIGYTKSCAERLISPRSRASSPKAAARPPPALAPPIATRDGSTAGSPASQVNAE